MTDLIIGEIFMVRKRFVALKHQDPDIWFKVYESEITQE
jgi:hypothetical protein